MIAEKVHGFRGKPGGKFDEIVQMLKDVANGEITLLDTPEEMADAQLPPGLKDKPKTKAFLKKMGSEYVRNLYGKAIRDHKLVAAEILASMTPLPPRK